MAKPVNIELVQVILGEVELETALEIPDTIFKFVPVESRDRRSRLFKKFFRSHCITILKPIMTEFCKTDGCGVGFNAVGLSKENEALYFQYENTAKMRQIFV